MKPKLLILLQVLLLTCLSSCTSLFAPNDINPRFYKKQAHDPEVIGLWTPVKPCGVPCSQCDKWDFRSNGEIYKDPPIGDDPLYKEPDWYYTKDGKLYYLENQIKEVFKRVYEYRIEKRSDGNTYLIIRTNYGDSEDGSSPTYKEDLYIKTIRK